MTSFLKLISFNSAFIVKKKLRLHQRSLFKKLKIHCKIILAVYLKQKIEERPLQNNFLIKYIEGLLLRSLQFQNIKTIKITDLKF